MSDGCGGGVARVGEGLAAGGELREGWRAILVCFCVALFAWGFGFYGQAVYLAELQRLHGWSAALISGATTVFYVAGALLMALVHSAIARFGPRRVLAGGAAVLAAGAIGIGHAAAPWQLYLVELAMAAGWACTASTAIATTLAGAFAARLGLAISLALTGASAAAFTIAPALVHLSHARGLGAATTLLALLLLVLLVPVILFGLGARPYRDTPHRSAAAEPPLRQRDALRDIHLWSVAAPFALALAAQVGFLMHQVAFLLPWLGAGGTGIALACTGVASVAGRLAVGLVIDRLNCRLVSAASFASQAAALLAMIAFPHRAAVLYAGSVVFGLSVGNVVTLPALILRQEFAAVSFAMLIGLCTAIGQFTFAFGPTLLGVVRDATGGYGAALGLCVALQLMAALLVLPGRWQARRIPA